MILHILFYLIAIFFPEPGQYKIAANSEFNVNGSSNVRSWTIASKTINGNAIIILEKGKIKTLEKIKVSLPAESLKSGRNGMDEHTYKALKTKEFPVISFSLDKINNIQNMSGHQILEAEGNVTIAGITKPVKMKVKSYMLDTKVFFEGELKTKMTEFNVTPPKALMGTLKTEDVIVISFKINFTPLKQII